MPVERSIPMSQSNLWIVYDERAAGGNPDDAAVFESCHSEREALRADFAGYVFRYDIDTDGKTLINETMVGPTRELARLQKRGR